MIHKSSKNATTIGYEDVQQKTAPSETSPFNTSSCATARTKYLLSALKQKEPLEYYEVQVPQKAHSKRLSKKLTKIRGMRIVKRPVMEPVILSVSGKFMLALNVALRHS